MSRKPNRLLWLIMVFAALCCMCGCSNCGGATPDAGGEAASVPDDDRAPGTGPVGLRAPGGVVGPDEPEAWLTQCTGECWSGEEGLGERLTPGTRIISRAALTVKNGFVDIFLPGVGVVRLQSGTAAELYWDGRLPVIQVRQGSVSAAVRGDQRVLLRLQTTRLSAELRYAGGVILKSDYSGDEIAVAWGDAMLAVDDRTSFVNERQVLLYSTAAGAPGALLPVAWPAAEVRAARRQLQSIMHAEDFIPQDEASVPEEEPAAAPARPLRGAIEVKRITSRGADLRGSCRIYDQTRDKDLFGTTLDFPQDMPIELPPGTYAVQLVYTDIEYPPRTDVEVLAGETAEVVFAGFGRLALLRPGAGPAALPLFFRVYDAVTRKEITRSSLELSADGIELELLPGTYNIEFIYVDNSLKPIDGIVIREGETTECEVDAR